MTWLARAIDRLDEIAVGRFPPPHAVLLAPMAAYILYFAIRIVIDGIPRGNFAWTPVLFALSLYLIDDLTVKAFR